MQDIKASQPWVRQTSADLQRHEGFREFAYPDPLSKIGRQYPARKYRWGFRPATVILGELGLNPKDGFPWTVGYGFTRGVNERSRMTKEYADKLLTTEMIVHTAGLEKLAPDWETRWPLFAQTVIVNLAFNMGIAKLAKFPNTLRYLNAKDWARAGSNLRQSLWFKQVGARARELVARLETQSIAPEHKVN